MNNNGHELEMIYVFKVSQLKQHKNNPKTLDFFWVKRYEKQLRKRLEKLENDFERGLVSVRAFKIWEKLINEAL